MSSHGPLNQIRLRHTIRIDHEAVRRPRCSNPKIASDSGEGALFELDQSHRGKLMLHDLPGLIRGTVNYYYVKLNGSLLANNRI